MAETEIKTQEEKKKRSVKRSPSYPMITLEESITKAKILWSKDKNNPIHWKAAYKDLGYNYIGGYGGRVLAALKKFGLIEENKDDVVLTKDAVDLAL